MTDHRQREDVEEDSACAVPLVQKDQHCWCQKIAERDLRCCRCGEWTTADVPHAPFQSFTL